MYISSPERCIAVSVLRLCWSPLDRHVGAAMMSWTSWIERQKKDGLDSRFPRSLIRKTYIECAVFWEILSRLK